MWRALIQVLTEAELKEELFVVWVPLHPELLFSSVNFSAREERKGKNGRKQNQEEIQDIYIYIYTYVWITQVSVEVVPAVSGQAAVNKKYFLLRHTSRERVNHITVSALNITHFK